MKVKLYAVLMLFVIMVSANAQIPYFSGTAGDGKIYGYTSVKFRPGMNAQETYTTFQYGVTDYVALGTDLYTGAGQTYWGFLLRGGYKREFGIRIA